MTATEHDDLTQLLDPLVVRAHQRVGQVLREKWHLDALLGVGGMAAVYAATHRNGSRVAIKILHTELSVNAQVRQRFLREGYVANTVAHDGAVKVADDDIAQDGSAFLVMELLDGETLQGRRERLGGTLSEDEVLSVADQLLDVLAAAHTKGIVHRDIKPENVFLTRDGRAKVLDFGIARLRELSSAASTATRSGATMGTPHYMPPEQARGRWDEVDGRSDLWALGATMFELLSGRMVHEGETANEVLLAAMTHQAPSLASVAPTISPTVCYVVDKALRYERERRWPDASSMQEAIRRAYVDRNGAQISTSPRLTVPETVPNRTLATAQAQVVARLPTTGQPVANSAPGFPGSAPALLPWRGRRLALVGAAAALGLLGVGLAVRSTRPPTSSPATSSGTTAPVSTPAASSVPSASPLPTAPPVVAATAKPRVFEVTDLPTAPTSNAAAPPPPSQPQPVRLVPPPPPAPTPPKPDCAPPYTVDSAGHRHWKTQCL
jgi:serine/threonine protein kinase